MLGFEAEAAAPLIGYALAGNGSVQEIPRVELYPRLGGVHFHDAPAHRVRNPGRKLERACFSVQHEVVVVAPSALDLQIVRVDAGAYGGRFREVEGRSCNRLQFSGGDQRLVSRCEPVCMEREFMAEDVPAAHSGQIEIGVLRQVDGGCLVRRGAVVDFEGVFVGERIGHFHIERTRVAFLSVRAGICEPYAAPAGFLERFRCPDHLVKASFAAVQVIGAVVGGKRPGFPVEGEGGSADPVSVPPDEGAEVGRLFQIPCERIVSKCDVAGRALGVRHEQMGNDTSIVRESDFHAVGIRQREEFYGYAVRLAERGNLYAGSGFRRFRIVRRTGTGSHEQEGKHREDRASSHEKGGWKVFRTTKAGRTR